MGVQTVSQGEIARVFLAAAGIALLALLFVAFTAPDRPRRSRRRQPPLWAVLRRYHPGSLLLVAAGGGLALGLPNTFLNAYANELRIPGIKTFFLIYAAVAFAVRILTRRLADRAGARPVAFWGLIWAAVATLSFVVVWDEWSMIIPALPLGIAHACLFPAVMAGGHACFPDRYRGLATTLMLAGFDVGNLIGQPAVGGMIDVARRVDLPPYPLMFGCVSLSLALIAAIYAVCTRPQKKPDPAGKA